MARSKISTKSYLHFANNRCCCSSIKSLRFFTRAREESLDLCAIVGIAHDVSELFAHFLLAQFEDAIELPPELFLNRLSRREIKVYIAKPKSFENS